METAKVDKRALARLLAGLVFCTLLTGFAALTVTGNALDRASSGYASSAVSSR